MTGADLTKLPSLDLLAVQRISSEIGLDLRRWPSAKHFCAWLNVAPNNLSGFSGPESISLIAAIILWNTRYLGEASVELERQGVNEAPTIVTHVAPLSWEHIGLAGHYVWTDAEQPSDGVLQPLRRRESAPRSADEAHLHPHDQGRELRADIIIPKKIGQQRRTTR
jgi:hypothetical protein